jgi:hypothetical protein
VLSKPSGDTDTCGHCGHTMHVEEWLNENYRQYKLHMAKAKAGTSVCGHGTPTDQECPIC